MQPTQLPMSPGRGKLLGLICAVAAALALGVLVVAGVGLLMSGRGLF